MVKSFVKIPKNKEGDIIELANGDVIDLEQTSTKEIVQTLNKAFKELKNG